MSSFNPSILQDNCLSAGAWLLHSRVGGGDPGIWRAARCTPYVVQWSIWHALKLSGYHLHALADCIMFGMM